MNFGPRNLVTLILVLLIPAVVLGQVPDIAKCDISTRATEPVSIMICPCCDGNGFEYAKTFGLTSYYLDATIEVNIRDGQENPINEIPAASIWMEAPGITWCLPEGNIVDFETGYMMAPDGYTEFALAPCGGGCSEEFTLNGFLDGTSFNENPITYIKFNSPDLSGDGLINLADLAQFAAIYWEPATYCTDFYWDGEMNLLDLALFAEHYTHPCNSCD
jgi:hypothetical protein